MTAPAARGEARPKKAVVVGGGIGGLSCACMLAGEGVDTLLIEKNKETGGTAGGFYHKDIHLELGCNISGPAGEGRTLTRFLRYFGVAGRVDMQMLPPDRCVQVHTKEGTIPLPAGIERYVEEVAARFPADGDEIRAFGSRVRFMMDNLPLYNIERYFDLAPGVETRILLSSESLAGALGNVENPTARKLLALFWRLSGTPPLLMPMSMYGPGMGAFLEGPCSLSGESLCTAMRGRIVELGGRIETLTRATKILVDRGSKRVSGVETGSGEVHEADLVVSTIHPLDTAALVDDDKALRRVKRRLGQAGETYGAFVSYFLPEGKKNRRDHRPGWHVILEEREDEPGEDERVDPETVDDFDIGLLASKPHPSPPEIERAILLFPPGSFDKWEHKKTRSRGRSYDTMKNRLAHTIKEKLQRAVPDIAEGLTHLTSITPLTLRDELGHRGGAFGLLRSSRLRGLATCSWKTPVGGMYLGGHSVLFPGITGAMETSFLVGAEVFGENHMVARFQEL